MQRAVERETERERGGGVSGAVESPKIKLSSQNLKVAVIWQDRLQQTLHTTELATGTVLFYI